MRLSITEIIITLPSERPFWTEILQRLVPATSLTEGIWSEILTKYSSSYLVFRQLIKSSLEKPSAKST